MTARSGDCRFCPRRIAVTTTGRLRPHGPRHDPCRGSGRLPAFPDLCAYDTHPTRDWPSWHYGRRVTTIPGPDTWNPKETAA